MISNVFECPSLGELCDTPSYCAALVPMERRHLMGVGVAEESLPTPVKRALTSSACAWKQIHALGSLANNEGYPLDVRRPAPRIARSISQARLAVQGEQG